MPAKSRKPVTTTANPHVIEEMLTPKEYAKAAKISESWLAKARKRGEGPKFLSFGRSVRYFPLGKDS